MPRRIDPSLIPEKPDFSYELALWKGGLDILAGIDEAGRGCLAGPVTAGAVILSKADDVPLSLDNIRDSKQMQSKQRDEARCRIQQTALSWGIGWASNQEIDSYGIVPATQLAAWRAVNQLEIRPDHLLVDYLVLPDIELPQTRLIKGDQRSLSIAAASILAKTHRDSWMMEYSCKYPQYGFDQNKGYGTNYHRQAIQSHGPCPLHRMSFSPLRDFPSH
jgi:ribonuclease HII